MLRRFLSSSLLVLALLGAMPAAQDTPTRLLRQPAISRELIAFVYAGDIWLVPIAGGYARQLTSGEGEELFPRFSPDGRTVAFTGQYDGRRQVYTIPVSGCAGRSVSSTRCPLCKPIPTARVRDLRVLCWSMTRNFSRQGLAFYVRGVNGAPQSRRSPAAKITPL